VGEPPYDLRARPTIKRDPRIVPGPLIVLNGDAAVAACCNQKCHLPGSIELRLAKGLTKKTAFASGETAAFS
jgi:hypothetical protein